MYYNGWGNICDDDYYNSTEANVICHQLGYTGASSYSRAGLVRYCKLFNFFGHISKKIIVITLQKIV